MPGILSHLPAVATGVVLVSMLLQPPQSGAETVRVVGTVRTDVTGIVETKDINAPGRHPYLCLFDFILKDGSRFTLCDEGVPEGRRLVIEQISVHAYAPPGQRLVVGVGPRFGEAHVHLFATLVDTDVSGFDELNGNLLTRLYVEGGNRPGVAFLQKHARPEETHIKAVISGYLMDRR